MGAKQHGNGNEKTLSRWLNYSCLLVGKLFKKCILEQDSEQKRRIRLRQALKKTHIKTRKPHYIEQTLHKWTHT